MNKDRYAEFQGINGYGDHRPTSTGYTIIRKGFDVNCGALLIAMAGFSGLVAVAALLKYVF